jgi:flagellar biogenesis protein FliO
MEFWESAVRMVASLALVLGLILALLAVAKTMTGKRWLGQSSTSLIQVLASAHVGTRKQVVVVSVAGEVLILGMTATDLVSLGRLTDPGQIQQALSQAAAGGTPADRIAAALRSHVGEHAG